MSDQYSTEPSLPSISGSPPLAGESIAFTGTLASMTHRQAQELTEQHGGTATEHVSRRTTMLVVGEEGWPLEPDGRPSQKLLHAQDLQQQASDIRILSESDWLRLLGLEERGQEVHRLYTPAMLSGLLGLKAGVIRSWERLGLIHPVRKVYRLPYFDFQEVAGVRRIAELLAAGVSRREIEAGLSALQSIIGGTERPLVQLDILARGSHLLYRDHAGLVEPVSGQRCLDFDDPDQPDRSDADDSQQNSVEGDSSPAVLAHLPIPVGDSNGRDRWSADEWDREGCLRLDASDAASAVEAFRMSLMERPGEAAVHFHLAEALYRLGNVDGALERYHAAVEADHNFIEAWTQLGCLYAEKQESNSAIDSLRIALGVHPDYPDAHWHLANVLHQLGRDDDARTHWQAYLRFDSRGPWAEQARQRIEQPDAT